MVGFSSGIWLSLDLSDLTETPLSRDKCSNTPVAIVSCGIVDYRSYTPTLSVKMAHRNPKTDLTRGVWQKKLASEAYRAIGGVARNSIANRAIVGHSALDSLKSLDSLENEHFWKDPFPKDPFFWFWSGFTRLDEKGTKSQTKIWPWSGSQENPRNSSLRAIFRDFWWILHPQTLWERMLFVKELRVKTHNLNI